MRALVALTLLATVLPTALAASPADVPCLDAAGAARACLVSWEAWGDQRQALEVTTADGSRAEVSLTEIHGFLGYSVVAMAWVDTPSGGANAGVGATDYYPEDGRFDHACACGAAYAPGVGWFPVGVYAWDSDGDGVMDTASGDALLLALP